MRDVGCAGVPDFDEFVSKHNMEACVRGPEEQSSFLRTCECSAVQGKYLEAYFAELSAETIASLHSPLLYLDLSLLLFLLPLASYLQATNAPCDKHDPVSSYVHIGAHALENLRPPRDTSLSTVAVLPTCSTAAAV